jgi:hypothetical protein
MVIVVGAIVSGAAALLKCVTDFLNRASDVKRAKVLSLIDYIEAARLAVAALALEGQEIVAQALAITPESEKAMMEALRARSIKYLTTDEYRPKLEIALAGIKGHHEYLNTQNETISDWPLGDAESRGKILNAVRELLKKLEVFLQDLTLAGPLIPSSGLLFIQIMQEAIEDGDAVAIREKALAAVQDPSYVEWRRLVVKCEEIVSDLKLKFN